MASPIVIPAWNQPPSPLEPSRRIERVTYCSPFAAQLIEKHPQWLDGIDEHVPPTSSALAQEVADHGLDSALRQFRNRHMLRIIWRDLSGCSTLDETFSDLTELAEISLSTAMATHAQALREQFGTPVDADGIEQHLAVIALGKFGGGELNLSSDIDIMFCYGNDGECAGTGKRKLSNSEFFTRLARAVIGSLAEVTADGFCFRVDTRLRPFGDSGPLCSSLSALEKYYQREGRDWERYALIKARLVAGPAPLGVDLMDRVRPFVYRRYIDFTAVEALQDMHASVIEDARRRDRLHDIKRGPGGIREIEFLVQCFQLLRGGREPLLQTPSLRQALAAVEELSLLNHDDIRGIRGDYVFLRQLENRIQAQHDRQTHELPEGEDFARLVTAMGYADTSELEERIARVRQSVADRFKAIFPNHDASASAAEPHWVEVWRRLQAERLQGDDGATPIEDRPLSVFLRNLDRLALSQRAQRRLDQFMPVLLHRLDRLELPDATLHRLFDLVLAISQRSAYLVLLVQHAAALDRLVELFARSEWIASRVIRFPALLDELIDPSLGEQIPHADDLRRSIDRILRSAGETESVLEALNYLKLATCLRIAVAQLEGLIESDAAQVALAELAGALLRGVLELASNEIATRHGRISVASEPDANAAGNEFTGNSLAIIAYGSLGAFEPGYESDLDIVFLFSGGDAMSDGVRPLPAERYYARLAQRLLSFLTAMTPSGRLYAVDTRLRPNGRAGALVSSLEPFAEYQRKEAWTWELQALTRARYVAGDPVTGAAFESIRTEVLRRPRDFSKLREDHAAMRHKMVQELGNTAGAPKHQPGGLVDIEFIVQLGTLAMASTHAAVTETTVTAEQLDELARAGWLSAEDAATLRETARALHRQRMLQALGQPVTPADTHAVAALFEKLVGSPGLETSGASRPAEVD